MFLNIPGKHEGKLSFVNIYSFCFGVATICAAIQVLINVDVHVIGLVRAAVSLGY